MSGVQLTLAGLPGSPANFFSERVMTIGMLADNEALTFKSQTAMSVARHEKDQVIR